MWEKTSAHDTLSFHLRGWMINITRAGSYSWVNQWYSPTEFMFFYCMLSNTNYLTQLLLSLFLVHTMQFKYNKNQIKKGLACKGMMAKAHCLLMYIHYAYFLLFLGKSKGKFAHNRIHHSMKIWELWSPLKFLGAAKQAYFILPWLTIIVVAFCSRKSSKDSGCTKFFTAGLRLSAVGPSGKLSIMEIILYLFPYLFIPVIGSLLAHFIDRHLTGCWSKIA